MSRWWLLPIAEQRADLHGAPSVVYSYFIGSTAPTALQTMSLADLFTAQLDELAAAEAAREARILQRIQRCRALAVELNDGVAIDAAAVEAAAPATITERLATIRSLLDEIEETCD